MADAAGGGAYLADGATLVVAGQAVVSGNTASAWAGGLYLSSPGAEVRNLRQVAMQNNQGGNPASGMYIDATDVTASNLLVADTITTAPLFITSARGRYRLSDLSPALDACGPASAMVDLDGYERPDGANYEIGAFEGAWGIPETLFADGFE